MSAPAARRLNTQYLSAERVAEIVHAARLPTASPASPATSARTPLERFRQVRPRRQPPEVGVIELMPVSDARSYAFGNGHPSNHRFRLPTVWLGVLADVGHIGWSALT